MKSLVNEMVEAQVEIQTVLGRSVESDGVTCLVIELELLRPPGVRRAVRHGLACQAS